jgi:hypothetical protein
MFGSDPQVSKKAALYICHRYSGKKLKEIDVCFVVGESAVSRSSRRFEALLYREKEIRKKIIQLYKKLNLSNV